MKRTTIVLSSSLRQRAKQAAAARGVTFSELVRQGIRRVLEEPDAAGYPVPRPIPLPRNINPPGDLARNLDDYLYGPIGSSSTRARSSPTGTTGTKRTRRSRR